MDGFRRGVDLKLCLRCHCVFVNPKYEKILYCQDQSEILSYLIKALKISRDDPLINDINSQIAINKGEGKEDSSEVDGNEIDTTICSCCFNFFDSQLLNQIVFQIKKTIHENYSQQPLTFSLQINIPPILETVRIGIRNLLHQSVQKLAPSPSFEELYSRYLTHFFQDTIEFISPEKSDIKIIIDVIYKDEEGLAVALDPQYRHCKKKRVIGAVNQSQFIDNYLVNRRDSENVLHAMKSLCGERNGFETLKNRILQYCNTRKDEKIEEMRRAGINNSHLHLTLTDWDCQLILQPIYLLGRSIPDKEPLFLMTRSVRYRKYSRDISQALWTLGAGADDDEGDGDGDCDDGDGGDGDRGAAVTVAGGGGEDEDEGIDSGVVPSRKRKGRGSVEEIIQEAVNRILLSKSCRMHPCGREDIDVRMLGNGRPVVIEILESKLIPTESLLNQIVQSINNSEGLNLERDIDLTCLSRVSKDVWTTMQAAAEEKNKAYMCVCWSEKPLTKQLLRELEALPDLDDKGVPCLRLAQKTPARVLHRRSLLSRERYLYQISTCQLNQHYFLLNLITSAGTYVKEFVHGDFGRTTPSVASILQSKADILQLDVMWLFDSFEGNCSDQIDLSGDLMYRGDSLNGGGQQIEMITWEQLKGRAIANKKKREISDSNS